MSSTSSGAPGTHRPPAARPHPLTIPGQADRLQRFLGDPNNNFRITDENVNQVALFLFSTVIVLKLAMYLYGGLVGSGWSPTLSGLGFTGAFASAAVAAPYLLRSPRARLGAYAGVSKAVTTLHNTRGGVGAASTAAIAVLATRNLNMTFMFAVVGGLIDFFGRDRIADFSRQSLSAMRGNPENNDPVSAIARDAANALGNPTQAWRSVIHRAELPGSFETFLDDAFDPKEKQLVEGLIAKLGLGGDKAPATFQRLGCILMESITNAIEVMKFPLEKGHKIMENIAEMEILIKGRKDKNEANSETFTPFDQAALNRLKKDKLSLEQLLPAIRMKALQEKQEQILYLRRKFANAARDDANLLNTITTELELGGRIEEHKKYDEWVNLADIRKQAEVDLRNLETELQGILDSQQDLYKEVLYQRLSSFAINLQEGDLNRKHTELTGQLELLKQQRSAETDMSVGQRLSVEIEVIKTELDKVIEKTAVLESVKTKFDKSDQNPASRTDFIAYTKEHITNTLYELLDLTPAGFVAEFLGSKRPVRAQVKDWVTNLDTKALFGFVRKFIGTHNSIFSERERAALLSFFEDNELVTYFLIANLIDGLKVISETPDLFAKDDALARPANKRGLEMYKALLAYHKLNIRTTREDRLDRGSQVGWSQLVGTLGDKLSAWIQGREPVGINAGTAAEEGSMGTDATAGSGDGADAAGVGSFGDGSEAAGVGSSGDGADAAGVGSSEDGSEAAGVGSSEDGSEAAG